MSDKINYKSFAIGALAAIGGLSYLRPDAAISPTGMVNWQNILVVGAAGGTLSYLIADTIEDASVIEKTKDLGGWVWKNTVTDPYSWSKNKLSKGVTGWLAGATTVTDILRGKSRYNDALAYEYGDVPVLGRVVRWFNR